MERHYLLEGAQEIMPYRVYVPAKYTGQQALPLIVALHGLGATEDAFFDSYGRMFPKLAEEHGYLVAAPLGYRVDGGYGMNYTTGSPMAKPDSFVSQPSDRLIIWDHRRSPGCSDSRITTASRPPWMPFTADSHYPPRHGGRMMCLFYDGHVDGIQPARLRVRNFREPDSGPPVDGFPGE